MKTNCKRRRGGLRNPGVPAVAFTLIELLVVVTVIAIIASMATPALMKSQNQSLARAANLERMQSDLEPLSITQKGTPPIIESFDLDLALSSESQRVGLEVYNRFVLDGSGTLGFRNPSNQEETIAVSIPFPKGTIEASNVRLLFESENGDLAEPDDVIYHQSGIFWTGQLDAGESVVAEVRFSTLGTEKLEFEMPPAKRLENIALDLDLSGTPAGSVTSYSLSPTEFSGQSVGWAYENLVSSRKIVVNVPGAQSPSGRLLLLLRYMAVAVALFGGGFLYMSEREARGSLDEFRLGHFFMLALTYSIFFIVFAVIIYREALGVVPALIISGLSSLPLVVLHVARITTPAFAIRKVLPLAILTLAVVVNGVYGDAVRDYVFLGILVIVVAYLTMTYRVPSLRKSSSELPLPAAG